MTIYLARHGQTAYNAIGRFQGQLDVPLDETGLLQAKELAVKVADLGLVALWSSPLARARQTAEAVSAHIGLPVQFDDRLKETDTGIWTDRLVADFATQDPDGYQGWISGAADFGFEGGETFAEQSDRVLAALTEIEQGPRPALVVCHGMSMRLALARRAADRFSTSAGIPNTAVIEFPSADPATAG
ncbi:histidine phosphatase family protein [Kibdelosporangium aridum]|uniref:histidine phosphatase family protein n=1 Tax=Kibdelosporangium aridum TaxID=2030 RepID=UPI00069028D9|nr:histidine phosphatase family protein [Kibdelosporangium aridum]